MEFSWWKTKIEALNTICFHTYAIVGAITKKISAPISMSDNRMQSMQSRALEKQQD